MKKLFILTLLFLFTIPIRLLAQSGNYIVGKIINSKTQEPVPFATIVLKQNKLGVFANADGDFRILIDSRFNSDSLVVTGIGIKRTGLLFNNLDKKKINLIRVTPITYSLAEVKVVSSRRKLSAEAVIRRAIRNIPHNYPVNSFNYISYYRDYQKRENNYINLNEAIVQTIDSGFSQNSSFNKYRLLDFRLNTDFQRMNIPPYYDTAFSPDYESRYKFLKFARLPDQGGNELFILMVHDPIRNFNKGAFSFVNNFSSDFIANHVFSDITEVYDNNLVLDKISFKAKKLLTGDSLRLSGDIYIQPKDYSIHKLIYSGYYVTKGNADKKMFSIDIQYGYQNSFGSLMRLNYISFNNIFNLIDYNDTSYFRMIKSSGSLKGTNLKFVIEFNHTPDSKSANNIDCYELFYDDTKVKITNVAVAGKSVILTVPSKTIKSLEVRVSFRNLRDIDGNTLNKRKSIEFYQYRELFVQDYNRNLIIKDSCYMQNIPLLQNCITNYISDKTYWMNTPINVITDK